MRLEVLDEDDVVIGRLERLETFDMNEPFGRRYVADFVRDMLEVVTHGKDMRITSRYEEDVIDLDDYLTRKGKV